MEIQLLNSLIRERLEYNPLTGDLTWKFRHSGDRDWSYFNETKAGKAAGGVAVQKCGYVLHRLTIQHGSEKVALVAARVCWFLHTGSWPRYTIDHINRNSLDHRIENLRDVPTKQNNENKGLYKGNVFQGVTKKDGRYWARVTKDGKTYRLGYYDTPQEAYKVCQDKKVELNCSSESQTRL